MQQEILTHPDGRRLGLWRLTDNTAERTVVFCHAAPGSGAFDPEPAQTGLRRVGLIAVDRPGYGGSDPMPPGAFATVGRAADDIAWVLDQLGLGPVGAAGWSAGGRVALALAARRPDLVDRVMICATPAPNDEVAWVPPEYAESLETMRGMAPEAAAAVLGEQLSGVLPSDPADPAALQMLGAGEADEAAIAAPGARERLTGMLTQAFARGMSGLAADIVGYSLQPWGFEPETVQAKALLLYGQFDAIGSRHGRWYQKRLPHARLEMAPRAGHLCIIPMWRRALSFLAPGALD